MKYLILLSMICFCGCDTQNMISNKQTPNELAYENYKYATRVYDTIAWRKLDSMQIINKFINILPNDIKSRTVITDAYMRNLNQSLVINNNRMRMNDTCFSMAVSLLSELNSKK